MAIFYIFAFCLVYSTGDEGRVLSILRDNTIHFIHFNVKPCVGLIASYSHFYMYLQKRVRAILNVKSRALRATHHTRSDTPKDARHFMRHTKLNTTYESTHDNALRHMTTVVCHIVYHVKISHGVWFGFVCHSSPSKREF